MKNPAGIDHAIYLTVVPLGGGAHLLSSVPGGEITIDINTMLVTFTAKPQIFYSQTANMKS